MICYLSEKSTLLNRCSQPTITTLISLIKYYANFLRFHPLLLKKIKTAIIVRLAFLKFRICIIRPASKQFTKSLSELVYRELGLKLRVVYDPFKINRYFQLKTKTPLALCSNVVYQFRCSCDTNLAYVGMTTRHLAARASKHLVLYAHVPLAVRKSTP